MYKRILIAAIIALPTIAFAQSASEVEGGLGSTLQQFDRVLKYGLRIAIPIAIAVFFWGLIKFIYQGDNSDLKAKGKKLMINSGIALFLMVGIWTVLAWIQSSVGLQGEQLQLEDAPGVQVIPGGDYSID